MSYDNIGRRYAKAIFDLGKEEGNATALATQIGDFAGAYAASSELRDVLDNPIVPDASKKAILVDLAQKIGASETAQRALRLIAQHRRLRALPDIARHLARLVDADNKVVRAEVTSAAPLSETYLGRLKAELEKATGNKVTISTSVDPSLIAGVVTRIGDQVIDGSARARLRGLREATTAL